MGTLETIAAALRNLRAAAQDSARAGKVGQAFMDASKQPDFWERGPSFADNVQGLNAQFGTESRTPYNGDAYAFAVRGARGPASGKVYDRLGDIGGAYAPDDAAPWMASGALPGKAPYHTFDTLDMGEGRGAGQRVYPSLFGMVRNDPGAYNIVEQLSNVNANRRNYNQAAAVMRDPEMSKRVLIAPSQLRSTFGKAESKDPARLVDWQRQTPAQQVGALQLMAAANALEQMGRTNVAPQLERVLQNPYSAANLQSLVRGWDPVRNIPHPDPRMPGNDTKIPFGDRSARRLGIVQGGAGGPGAGTLQLLEQPGVPGRRLSRVSHPRRPLRRRAVARCPRRAARGGRRPTRPAAAASGPAHGARPPRQPTSRRRRTDSRWCCSPPSRWPPQTA